MRFIEFLTLCCGLLPASRLKNRLLVMAGHSVHESSIIKPVVFLGATRIDAASNSSVGAFSVFRNVDLSLAENAVIGQLNWISSAPFLVKNSLSPNAGRLVVGEHAAITNRHYIDSSGGVVLDPYSIVAGVRSTLMSHGIDVGSNELVTDVIRVGAYSMVGGNCNLVLGAHIPSHSLVAMGSTVVRGLSEVRGFYAGVPAKYRKPVDGAFFERASGEVLPRVVGEKVRHA